MSPVLSVVVLAYGDEPELGSCIRAVLASRTTRTLDLVVVDNGSPAVADLPTDPRLRLVTPATNVGFAGGCNVGVGHTRGELVAFVNSDAVVEPDALETLATALDDPALGLVSGCVLLADRPELLNTCGNPVHFTGIAWAGGYGEPAAEHSEPRDITSVSGALFATRRSHWDDLGGFDPAYFAYHEDVDLSLRTWQRGLRVRYVPAARAVHHYEFHRNPAKLQLLERNRLQTLVTTYPRPLLRRLLPALVLLELGLCLAALLQGWLGGKVRAYLWLVRHRQHLQERRAAVQSASTLSAREFADLLEVHLRPANVERPPGLPVLDAALSTYFGLVRRTLPAR